MSAIRFVLAGLFLLTPIAGAIAQTPSPASTPAPSSASSTAPAPVAPTSAETLQAQLAMLGDGQRGLHPLIHAADIRSFYAQTGGKAVWQEDGRLSALITQLELLVDDGLQPEDYAVEHLLQRLAQPGVGPDQREAAACDELLATRAYLLALAHLNRGKLDPAEVESQWSAKESSAPDLSAIVKLAAENVAEPAKAFAAARPTSTAYAALRKAYVAMRDKAPETAWPAIPAGPSLRPGDTDARVAAVRARLLAAGFKKVAAQEGAEATMDDALVEGVKQFQKANGLEADGIVGRSTRAALNVTPAERVEQLRANLERQRWFNTSRPDRLVQVDVAGAHIRYFNEGKLIWEGRSQVGRPNRPTPLLHSEITHFTLNPTWTVPPTILRQDKLPEIREDITFIERNRFRVLDQDGNELVPEEIDWSAPGNITLRQDAGPGNALGQVAIRFPNPFSVYLHDTPSKGLFARERRTTSSGCVRVENAMTLVEHLLADAGDMDAKRTRELLDSGRTRRVNLVTPVPVQFAYWTVGVGDNGEPLFRADIYGLDARVNKALSKRIALAGDGSACK